MRFYDTVVDLSFRFGEAAMAQQIRELLCIFHKGQEIVQIGSLTEVRADRVQEDQLQVYVSFDKIDSRFMLITVDDVKIFHAAEIVQAVFNNVSVDHLFVGFLNFTNLILHLVFKDIIEMSNVLML